MILSNHKYLLFLVTLCVAIGGLHAQTPGEIVEGSTGYTGSAGWGFPYTPIDPDGDGWIIDDGDPFLDVSNTVPSAALQTDFADNERVGTGTAGASLIELKWIGLPQIDTEPNGDPRLGAACGQADIVDDPVNGAEASYVYFYTHPTEGDLLLYRIRIATDPGNGSFGYSVLMDIDGKIGVDDPNSVTGNIGFEYEIRFRNGFDLFVDDVDGTTSGTNLFTYTQGTHDQRAAAVFDGGCGTGDPTFFDWWIKLSDIGATVETGVRLAAATSQNGASVLGNTGADVAGVDDGARIGGGLLFEEQDDALDSLIRLQSPTPIGDLDEGGCFITDDADVPVINQPILDSQNFISGTSTEDDGTDLIIRINGTNIDTVSINSGVWTYTFDNIANSLRPFDEIIAVANPQCENETESAIVNVTNDLDSDNDGIPDASESGGVDPGDDADGDNIPNFRDPTYPGYTDTNMDGVNDLFDQDGDGLPDHLDTDNDGDGIPDILEMGGTDTNGDGVFDAIEDADNDGIPDSVDADTQGCTDTTPADGICDTDQGGTDTDGDGIDDTSDPDADGDGLADALESSPLTITDTDGDGNADYLDGDTDGDGISDSQEAQYYNGTSSVTDQDGNGINDIFEDSDSDGIPNHIDGDTSYNAGCPDSSPADGICDSYQDGPDADGDDIEDSADTDVDGDGVPNYKDLDSDGDGIADYIEAQATAGFTITTGVDTNNDGVDDAYGTPITIVDTDGDNIPDYLDSDSDGDGVPDIIEGNDANRDGVSDITFDGTDTDGDGIADIFDTDDANYGPIDTSVALGDTDGDTEYDFRDTDDDGDGTLTSAEDTNTNSDWSDDFSEGGGVVPNYLFDPDYDGDGVDDVDDFDSDNDGILDTTEDGGTGFDPTGDADGDLIPNYLDQSDATSGFPTFVDSNGDGINDAYDTDLDGIPDFQDRDSDGDGITDVVEAGGADSGNGIIAGTYDVNGLTTGGSLTPPNTDLATDPTGAVFANPYDIDSDNDGIPDNIEAQASGSYTSPTGNDADRDGIDDAYDIDAGGTAITPENTDGDTGPVVPDYIDTDSDDDGIPDIVEAHDANRDGEGDWDGNGNQTVDNPDGNDDPDGDGLLEAFDTDEGGMAAIFSDTDGDGTPDYRDTDDDGDGTPTASEDNDPNDGDWTNDFNDGGGVVPNYLFNPDFDGDGINDSADLDSDNDGILDSDEDGGTGNDPTALSGGTPNYLNVNGGNDSNGDGIVDDYDADLDGIPDFQDLDSDNDGVLDIVEAGGTDANNDGLVDGFTDVAGGADGIDDTIGTGGLTNPDSDGDLIPDARDVDSDNDGVPDITENGGIDTNNDGRADDATDADNDGIADLFDTDSGNTPLSTTNTDGDAAPDYLDLDSDNDGIADLVESGGTDADNDGLVDSNADNDGDGLANTFDSDNGGTPLTDLDLDGDGLLNAQDNDSDEDGMPDNVEAQATVGYAAPSGSDADSDGIDDDFEAGFLSPTNTDGKDNPDYLDTDSDNDGVSDLIEMNDANQDGVSDRTPTGMDDDGDGIDSAFDDDDATYTATGSDTSTNRIDTDGAEDEDYRDTDDDNDTIFTTDEPLDLRGTSPNPDYLEDLSGSCGVGFVTNDFAGNADAIGTFSGASDRPNILGSGTDAYTTLGSNGSFILVDLTDTVPSGESVSIFFRSTSASRFVELTVTSADDFGGTFAANVTNPGTDNVFTTVSTHSNEFTAVYTPNVDNTVRWLRLEFTDNGPSNPDLEIDNLSYSFTICEEDWDNDGVADIDDADDDNDGIEDSKEGLGVNPSLDTDDDGILDYKDQDGPGVTAWLDVNGDGINDNFDFDLDGIPNHLDLDADNDGIPDAIEANGGTLPANMQDDGQFSVSVLQLNDNNGNGLHNSYDPDDAGDGTFGDLNTDDPADTNPDFLDLDSDNDGSPDYVEAFDTNGDGDSLEEYIAFADAYTSASGSSTPYDNSEDATPADGIPEWLELNPDGIPRFLDPNNTTYYRDTDGDGLVDLFDTDSFGDAPVPNPDYVDPGSVVGLPLDFIGFTTTLVNGSVLVEWVTTNEEDVEYFDIERSIDGTDFFSIGNLPALNNSPAVNTYEFVDGSPNLGYNYYRITEYDFDGRYESTDIVFVLVSQDGRELMLTPYPNPVVDFMKIGANVPLAGVAFQLMDMSGRRTIEGILTNEESINMSAVPTGLYVLKINLPDRVFNFKVIKR
ncbi:MAG: T9SS type A sorting domain-containing protein [Cyclobacteriaceae bacterium]